MDNAEYNNTPHHQPVSTPPPTQSIVPEQPEPPQKSRKSKTIKTIVIVVSLFIIAATVYTTWVTLFPSSAIFIFQSHTSKEITKLLKDQELINHVTTSTEKYLKDTYQQDFSVKLLGDFYYNQFTNNDKRLVWFFSAQPSKINDGLFSIIYASRKPDGVTISFEERPTYTAVTEAYQQKLTLKNSLPTTVQKFFKNATINFNLTENPENIKADKYENNYKYNLISISLPQQAASLSDKDFASIYQIYLAVSKNTNLGINVDFDNQNGVNILNDNIYCANHEGSTGFKQQNEFAPALKSLFEYCETTPTKY